jgi:hypothetical protein
MSNPFAKLKKKLDSKLATKQVQTNGANGHDDRQQQRPQPKSQLKSDQRKSLRGPTRPAPLPSYAETVPHNPREGIPASEPRQCRQLLRELYAMNIFIMNCTHVFEANKPLIREKEQRAEAALTDLRQKTESWLAAEGEWSPKELKIILEIHEQIKQMQPVPVQFNIEERENIISDRTGPDDTESTIYSTYTTSTQFA